MTIARPKKLRSGDWGAIVDGRIREGESVRIRTRAGKEWTAYVSKVVWTDGSVTIFATSSITGRNSRSRSSSGECEGGACDDLMSMGYAHMAGKRIRCSECGGWADVS